MFPAGLARWRWFEMWLLAAQALSCGSLGVLPEWLVKGGILLLLTTIKLPTIFILLWLCTGLFLIIIIIFSKIRLESILTCQHIVLILDYVF